MDIEQVLPHVLDCIDTDRLGPRKVAMLELVYIRQGGKRCSVHLGNKDLEEVLDGGRRRSRHQASYDRRALAELVKLGMLKKLPGRGSTANAYSLREPKNWDSKKIRFLGERKRILDFFWVLQPRDLIRLSRDGAGQSMFFEATGLVPLRATPRSLPRDPSVDERAAKELPARGKLSRSYGDRDLPSRGEPKPPSQLPLVSKETELVEEEEGRLPETGEGERLGRVVAGRIGKKRLWGDARQPIEQLLVRYPDHVEDLYTLAETLKTDAKYPINVALDFLAAAEVSADRGWPAPRDHLTGSQPFSKRESSDPEMDPEAHARMLQSIRGLADDLRIASSR
jgi:hypothetical protein